MYNLALALRGQERIEDAVAALLAEASAGPITLLFSSRETQRNNANALKAYLENHATPSS